MPSPSPDPNPAAALSREALRSDLDSLVSTIESTHPDPFVRCGGRVSFYRVVHETAGALPDAALPVDVEGLFAPVVAQVHDAHTWLRGPGAGEATAYPVDCRVVEGELVVTATGSVELADLIGSRLRSVNGIPLPALLRALSEVVGADNEVDLATRLGRLLREPVGLARLCRRATPGSYPLERVGLGLLTRSGEQQAVTLLAGPQAQDGAGYEAPSTIDLPDLGDADRMWGLGWAAMPGHPEVMYVRSRMCAGFRETYEVALCRGQALTVADWRLSQLLGDRADPDGRLDPALLREVPSAAEELGRLCDLARASGARHLLVDVRDNPGGISLIAGILVAAFYGVGEVERPRSTYDVPRVSPLLAQSFPNPSLHADPLTGGLDFTFLDRSLRLPPDGRQDRYVGDLEAAGSFQQELGRRGRGPWWRPEQAVVLTSNRTASAAMSIVEDLVRAGAVTAGSPSAQSGNCFGDSLTAVLPNSKATLFVSYRAIRAWPDDPERGHLLRPDLPLTYAELARRDFDPNATVGIALDWLASQG